MFFVQIRKVNQNNPLIIQSPEKLFAPEEIEKLFKTILSLFNPQKSYFAPEEIEKLFKTILSLFNPQKSYFAPEEI